MPSAPRLPPALRKRDHPEVDILPPRPIWEILPTEIMHMIVHGCFRWDRFHFRQLKTLLHVDKKMRAMVLNSPKLWSMIIFGSSVIGPGVLSLAAACVVHSKSTALDVSIGLDSNVLSFLPEIQSVVDLLISATHRIRSLDVDLKTNQRLGVIQQLWVGRPMSQLEELSILHTEHSRIPWNLQGRTDHPLPYRLIDIPKAPHLRSLILKGVVPRNNFSFNSLTNVHVDVGHISFERLAYMITSAPAMKHLVLEGCQSGEADQDQHEWQTLACSELTTLRIANTDGLFLSNFLRSLVAPKLDTIRLMEPSRGFEFTRIVKWKEEQRYGSLPSVHTLALEPLAVFSAWDDDRPSGPLNKGWWRWLARCFPSLETLDIEIRTANHGEVLQMLNAPWSDSLKCVLVDFGDMNGTWQNQSLDDMIVAMRSWGPNSNLQKVEVKGPKIGKGSYKELLVELLRKEVDVVWIEYPEREYPYWF